MKIMLVSVAYLSLAIGSICSAQVEVEGNVEGNWTMDDSPYIVTGDITVRNGDELTIEPGVEVRFQENRQLVVNGLLTAVGEEDNRILFTAEDREEMWQAVRLIRPDDNCEISFCIFELSEQTGEYNDVDSRGAALYGERCDNLTVSNCIFRNTNGSGQGTVCFYYTTGEFTDNQIVDNETYTEIAVFETSPMLIARNIVEHNVSEYGAGIFVLHESPDIIDNIIRHNVSTVMDWGAGLYLVSGCQSVVRGNLIYGNRPGGIFIGYESWIEEFVNNVVYDNGNAAGIFLVNGGIVNIKNSIIWNNVSTISVAGDDNSASAEYSVLQHFHNIQIGDRVMRVDPDFVDPDEDDFNLLPISYCVDAAHPDSPDDPDDSRGDIGVTILDHDGDFPFIALDMDDVEVDEGDDVVVSVVNVGDFPLWVALSSDVEWIEVDPELFRKDPDDDQDIFLTISDRRLGRGQHEAIVNIMSSDPEIPLIEFPITLNVDIERPVWDEIPEDININETEEISFDVRGSDPDDEDNDLRIICNLADLPDGAEFEDHGNASGTFFWQPGYEDSGEYIVIFTISDEFFDIQTEVLITVNNVNRAPVIDTPLEDLVLNEDQGVVVAGNLIEVFVDLDGDELQYFTSAIGGISLVVDEDINLLVIPDQDWNGVARAIITASDGEETVSDTILITVNPVNDLPTDFNLVSPGDDEYVDSYPTIEFTWDASIDEVEGSPIIYTLKLSYSNRTLTYEDIDNTNFSVNREEFSLNSDEPTELTWQVWASDGSDSVRCMEPFIARVAPLSISLKKDRGIPEHLALISPYPNPFNSTTSVEFHLPTTDNVSITLINNSGLEVMAIENGVKVAGVHQVSIESGNLPSGSYYVVLTAGNVQLTKSVTLLR